MSPVKGCPLCEELEADEITFMENGARFLLCRRCGLGYWSDRWDSSRAQRHYHEYYSPESFQHDPLTEKRYHSLLGRLEKIRQPGRLLDVGCGAGQFLCVAESRGWEAAGLEISESALQALRRVQEKEGCRFRILPCAIEEANFPSEDFDLVSLFEVLEHLEDPLALLRQVHRVLKPGGLLFLTTPNYNSVSRRLLGPRWRVVAGEHRCLFAPRALGRSLEMCGFHPLTITTKNIDLSEIIAKWGLSSSYRHPSRKDSPSQRLRHQVEGSPCLRGLKGAANALLAATGSGDTIQLLAAKREGGGLG